MLILTAYAAPVPQRPMTPAPPSLPSKEDLNQQMRLINRVFGQEVFDKHDLEYPYDQEKDKNGKILSKKIIIDPKIRYGTQIIRAIVFKKYSNEANTYTFSQAEKHVLDYKSIEHTFTREQQDMLAKAIPLNTLLLRTDLNDAEKTAKGIQFLANANTNSSGQLNKEQFTKDLAKYFIDQDPNFIGMGARALAGVGNSPIAYVLFGGPRISANGWKPELYDKAGEPQHNQAHHLAMFIIEGMNKGRDIAEFEASVLDNFHVDIPELGINWDYRNENDMRLSKIGIELGRLLIRGNITIQDLEKIILKEIEE